MTMIITGTNNNFQSQKNGKNAIQLKLFFD